MSPETQTATTETPPAAGATTEAPPADAGKKPDATTMAGGGAPAGVTDGAGAPQGAPESYEAFTMPEGAQLDPALLEMASPAFKEAGFTQAQGQVAVDLHNKIIDGQNAESEKLKQDWKNQLAEDKDLGGANLEANGQRIAELVTKFGDAELQTWLNETGFGDYPPINRFLLKITREFKEDGFAGSQGGAASRGTTTESEKFYGKK